jgi:DNA-binding GntR family transcriptional regulator
MSLAPNASSAAPPFDMRVLTTTVQRGAVEKLRYAILAGLYKPGDRLVEASLCDLLGISRASVREALRSLEAERLIEIVPNRGPLVRVLSWSEAAEIYDVRTILEGEAAALFASKATKQQIASLRAAWEAFQAAVARDDAHSRVLETTRFYEIIFEGCGNRIIQEVLQGLLARITFLRHRSMSRQGRAGGSVEELERILLAIEAGSRKDARRAAVDHIAKARAAAQMSFKTE